MKINGLKFSQLDKIFLGVFFECVPDIIDKWKSYILSNNNPISFDTFLLELTEESTPKKYRTMSKHFKKRVPKIITLWLSYNTNLTFDEWCLQVYDRHKNKK